MESKNKLTKEIAEKIEKLYREHRDVMFSDAKYILKDTSLAEDAVESAIEKIIKRFDKVPKDDFEITRSYLRTVVKHVAFDMCKKMNNQNLKVEYIDEFMSIENQKYSTSKNPCDELIEKEYQSDIYKLIEKLPEKYKEVLIYEKIYGYSQKEIAEHLNISYDAVKKRMERARKMLKKEMRKEELI